MRELRAGILLVALLCLTAVAATGVDLDGIVEAGCEFLPEPSPYAVLDVLVTSEPWSFSSEMRIEASAEVEANASLVLDVFDYAVHARDSEVEVSSELEISASYEEDVDSYSSLHTLLTVGSHWFLSSTTLSFTSLDVDSSLTARLSLGTIDIGGGNLVASTYADVSWDVVPLGFSYVQLNVLLESDGSSILANLDYYGDEELEGSLDASFELDFVEAELSASYDAAEHGIELGIGIRCDLSVLPFDMDGGSVEGTLDYYGGDAYEGRLAVTLELNPFEIRLWGSHDTTEDHHRLGSSISVELPALPQLIAGSGARDDSQWAENASAQALAEEAQFLPEIAGMASKDSTPNRPSNAYMASAVTTEGQTPTIIVPVGASLQEALAAKEVRRYVYLRTDEVLPIHEATTFPSTGDLILVANEANAMVGSLSREINHSTTTGGFILKTVHEGGRNILVITGNDSFATLYGAYRFAEHLGVGFDLAIDAIPDKKITLDITGFDEAAEPRFVIRGIHPFHNMLSGPDNWHTSDYMVVMSQLAKMGMNFIGLHCYGDGEEGAHNEGDGPEPQVWIGLESDVDADGTVNWSSPAYNAHTHRVKNNGTLRIWGYDTWDTDQFGAGASEVFATNGWGNDMMGPELPTRDNDVAGWNAIYNRYGESFNQSFTFGRMLGVQTAIGTEMTLTTGGHPIISPELRARIGNPNSDETIKSIYRGIFARIMRAHPLDYYWLWMDENEEVDEEDALAEVPLAIQALQEVDGAEFELAFTGWDCPDFLEEIVPNAAFSGFTADGDISGFEELTTTRKWPITWAEEDWGIIQPQTEVLHAVRLAQGAFETDCEGFLAQFWRSRAPSKELHAMHLLQWAYGPTGAPVDRSLPSDDDAIVYAIYLDWCTRQFGSEVARSVADILVPLDLNYYGFYGPGGLPTPTFWDTDDGEYDEAPGAIMSSTSSWSSEQSKYAFVGQLEALRSQVVGAGNLERFDYVLKSMQALRLYGEYGCIRSDFETAMRRRRYEQALSHRRAMARLYEQILTLKLESITNNNELGEICNLEIVNWKALMINKWDDALRAGLGGEIPADAYPSRTYQGGAFIKVVPARTVVEEGEALTLHVLVMGIDTTPTLKYRLIGTSDWSSLPLTHVARAVYEVTIPAQPDDFEYCIESGSTTFPVTAPSMYHTVVVAGQVSGNSTSALAHQEN